MNLYKFHSNPKELIGYTDRDWVFPDEAEDLFAHGKYRSVSKIVGDFISGGGLPPTVTITGGLDITRQDFPLSDKMNIGTYVWLDQDICESLEVIEGVVYLGDKPMETFPYRFTAGWDISLGSEVDVLKYPSNLLYVAGNLDLAGTPITSLPDNLTVQGSLYLDDTPIKSLPDNLTVHGTLTLVGTQITALPDNLIVDESLWLDDTPIKSLPDNLTVGGNLDLRSTPITSLPDNLTVGGYLHLGDTPNLDKDNLPSSLVVKGEIIYD
jgi:hypothetical protein